MRMAFASGSEIIFVGLDDVEKLKSIYDITGIWVEEASEITEQDFNQLDIRLRTAFPHYLQIILTFNPITAQHWLKRRFWDKQDPRALTHESTYKDNRFLPQDAIDTLLAFKDTDPYYYMVYALNQWGVTGKTVFDAQSVTERLACDIRPIKQGLFTYSDDGRTLSNITWTDQTDGPVRIYIDVDKSKPYVIGGDTAGDGSDSFVGQVLDNTDGRQVAVLRHQYDSGAYAKKMYCLGMYYNSALIGIESNFDMFAIKELERLCYPRQYVREELDSYTNKPKQTFGFRTTSANRETIISALIEALKDNYSLVCDKSTLEEMLTFVRNEKMRAEAQQGAHDDCIMALAIAHHIRGQQRYTLTPNHWEGKDWTEDMYEDYRNADKAGKEYLIKKWGHPVG
jgi:phage terminase large subunit